MKTPRTSAVAPMSKIEISKIFSTVDSVLDMWNRTKFKLRANSLRIHEGWLAEFDTLTRLRINGDAVGCTLQMVHISRLLPLVVRDLNKIEFVGAKERGVKLS